MIHFTLERKLVSHPSHFPPPHLNLREQEIWEQFTLIKKKKIPFGVRRYMGVSVDIQTILKRCLIRIDYISPLTSPGDFAPSSIFSFIKGFNSWLIFGFFTFCQRRLMVEWTSNEPSLDVAYVYRSSSRTHMTNTRQTHWLKTNDYFFFLCVCVKVQTFDSWPSVFVSTRSEWDLTECHSDKAAKAEEFCKQSTQMHEALRRASTNHFKWKKRDDIQQSDFGGFWLQTCVVCSKK